MAKYLEKTFLEQREREEEEKVSLLQLCKGRIQKESARLFYETLVCPQFFTISCRHLFYCLNGRFKMGSSLNLILQVLKTKGYLEVKQDHPYSDVLLTPLARQQKAC